MNESSYWNMSSSLELTTDKLTDIRENLEIATNYHILRLPSERPSHREHRIIEFAFTLDDITEEKYNETKSWKDFRMEPLLISMKVSQFNFTTVSVSKFHRNLDSKYRCGYEPQITFHCDSSFLPHGRGHVEPVTIIEECEDGSQRPRSLLLVESDGYRKKGVPELKLYEFSIESGFYLYKDVTQCTSDDLSPYSNDCVPLPPMHQQSSFVIYDESKNVIRSKILNSSYSIIMKSNKTFKYMRCMYERVGPYTVGRLGELMIEFHHLSKSYFKFTIAESGKAIRYDTVGIRLLNDTHVKGVGSFLYTLFTGDKKASVLFCNHYIITPQCGDYANFEFVVPKDSSLVLVNSHSICLKKLFESAPILLASKITDTEILLNSLSGHSYLFRFERDSDQKVPKLRISYIDLIEKSSETYFFTFSFLQTIVPNKCYLAVGTQHSFILDRSAREDSFHVTQVWPIASNTQHPVNQVVLPDSYKLQMVSNRREVSNCVTVLDVELKRLLGGIIIRDTWFEISTTRTPLELVDCFKFSGTVSYHGHGHDTAAPEEVHIMQSVWIHDGLLCIQFSDFRFKLYDSYNFLDEATSSTEYLKLLQQEYIPLGGDDLFLYKNSVVFVHPVTYVTKLIYGEFTEEIVLHSMSTVDDDVFLALIDSSNYLYVLRICYNWKMKQFNCIPVKAVQLLDSHHTISAFDVVFKSHTNFVVFYIYDSNIPQIYYSPSYPSHRLYRIKYDAKFDYSSLMITGVFITENGMGYDYIITTTENYIICISPIYLGENCSTGLELSMVKKTLTGSYNRFLKIFVPSAYKRTLIGYNENFVAIIKTGEQESEDCYPFRCDPISYALSYVLDDVPRIVAFSGSAFHTYRLPLSPKISPRTLIAKTCSAPFMEVDDGVEPLTITRSCESFMLIIMRTSPSAIESGLPQRWLRILSLDRGEFITTEKLLLEDKLLTFQKVSIRDVFNPKKILREEFQSCHKQVVVLITEALGKVTLYGFFLKTGPYVKPAQKDTNPVSLRTLPVTEFHFGRGEQAITVPTQSDCIAFCLSPSMEYRIYQVCYDCDEDVFSYREIKRARSINYSDLSSFHFGGYGSSVRRDLLNAICFHTKPKNIDVLRRHIAQIFHSKMNTNSIKYLYINCSDTEPNGRDYTLTLVFKTGLRLDIDRLLIVPRQDDTCICVRSSKHYYLSSEIQSFAKSYHLKAIFRPLVSFPAEELMPNKRSHYY